MFANEVNELDDISGGIEIEETRFVLAAFGDAAAAVILDKPLLTNPKPTAPL